MKSNASAPRISPAVARWFSDAILSIYAAEGTETVTAAYRRAERGVGDRQGHDWLLGLLRGHVEHRCEQLCHNPAKSPPQIATLTAREQEVLQRIALGETDAAIGAALGIAPKTASKHVENILHKLGVETRTAAAAALRRDR